MAAPNNTNQDQERRSRKLFIGGVSFSTTDEDFFTYFAKYGELEDCVLIREKDTGESRGFGFVTYKDKTISDHVAKQELFLDGRRLDAKPSISKYSMDQIHEQKNQSTKVFMGGLHDDTSEAEVSEHFSTFGEVLEVNIMYDRLTNKPRGFGFVTFQEIVVAQKVIHCEKDHVIHGKKVDCKPATVRKDAHSRSKSKPTSREERWKKYHTDNIDPSSHASHTHGYNNAEPYAHAAHSSYSHSVRYPTYPYPHPSYTSQPYPTAPLPPSSSSYGYSAPAPPTQYAHPHYDPYYRYYAPPPQPQPHAPGYDYYSQYPPQNTQPIASNADVKNDDKNVALSAPVKPMQPVPVSYGPARGSKATNSAQGARYNAY